MLLRARCVECRDTCFRHELRTDRQPCSNRRALTHRILVLRPKAGRSGNSCSRARRWEFDARCAGSQQGVGHCASCHIAQGQVACQADVKPRHTGHGQIRSGPGGGANAGKCPERERRSAIIRLKQLIETPAQVFTARAREPVDPSVKSGA